MGVAVVEAGRAPTEPGSPGFMLKRWEISVTWASGAVSTDEEVAPTRGKALARAWACDAFSGTTFGEFLRFARCRRSRYTPPRYGDPITVEGRPAFFIDNNRQYVRFAYPGAEHTMVAHPYDVLPVEYRPDTYRGRDSDGSPEGRDAQQLDGEAATARADEGGIAQGQPHD